MLYGCNHMATVGVKGLCVRNLQEKTASAVTRWLAMWPRTCCVCVCVCGHHIAVIDRSVRKGNRRLPACNGWSPSHPQSDVWRRVGTFRVSVFRTSRYSIVTEDTPLVANCVEDKRLQRHWL